MTPSAAWSRRRILFLAAGGGILSGCNILPEVNEPVPLYELVEEPVFEGTYPPLEDQLTIAVPIAAANLDTTRIALSKRPGVIEYYAKGAWADNAPVLLQSRIVAAFEKNGAIRAVGRDAAGLRPDLVLQSDLRSFQAEYLGPTPSARIRIAVRLVRMQDRRIVHFFEVDRMEPIKGQSLGDIVKALDHAAALATADIVMGVLQTLI